jgi:DNA repair exonuclease SbcCD ATPase subunit
MRLLKAGCTNFLLLAKAKIDYRRNGLVLIEGRNHDDSSTISNAAAKSTAISHLLSYVLFGKTTEGKKGSDVINWTAKKNCHVWVTFKVKNRKCRIDRYQKCKGHKNGVVFTVDGEDKSKAKPTETNQLICQYIGATQDVFKYTTLFGQGMLNRFTKLGPQAQQQLLEDIASLKVYDDATTISRRRASDVSSRADQKDSLCEAKKEERQRIKAVLAKLREQDDEERSAKKEARAKIKAALKVQKAQLEELEDKANDYGNEAAEAESSWSNLDRRKKRLTTQEGELDLETTLMQETKKCSKCKQPLEKHSTVIQKDEVALERVREELEVIRVRMTELTAKAEEAREGEQKYEKRGDKVADGIRNLKAELRNNVVPTQSASVETVSKTLKAVSKEYKKLNADRKELRKVHRYAEKLSKQVFPAVRSKALSDVVSYVNRSLERYVALLFDKDMSIQLTTDTKLKTGETRSKISLVVRNREGDYGDSSGGESDKIDMAIAFALHDAAQAISNFSCNILVIDEPANAVDARGVGLIVKALQEKLADLDSIFLISHRSAFKGLVESTWMVVRDKGFSRIESATF